MNKILPWDESQAVALLCFSERTPVYAAMGKTFPGKSLRLLQREEPPPLLQKKDPFFSVSIKSLGFNGSRLPLFQKLAFALIQRKGGACSVPMKRPALLHLMKKEGRESEEREREREREREI